ncbi:hypothetical protein MMC13_007422 [Lambiella insularis]|nr:hypothetical protein [Lambiella insularis]
MYCNVEPSNLMKSRKRAREDDISSSLPATKHLRLELESSLPTPSPTASSIHDPSTQRSKARKQPRTSPPRSEPGPPNRALEDPNFDRALPRKPRRQSLGNASPTWFRDRWLQSIRPSGWIQEEIEGSDTLPTIEAPGSSQIPVQAASDQMSQQQDGETLAPGSVASSQSERLNTSSPMFRGTLKMNGSVIDNFGTKIPQEVQELVDKHIRKERKSPPLGNDDKAEIREKVGKVWDKAEPMVSDLLKTSLFPLDAPGIAEGRDIIWSTKPLPRNLDYPYALPAPKTDRHFGFRTSQDSDWTVQQLAVADHSKVRPYSQPTRENLFPSYLVEIKSEATNGTIYAGEGQVALGGVHRVSSLLWILDHVDPSRTPSSTDALVFSAVVSQREAVAHVHYYNPGDHTYYMSYIDSFSFQKDAQGCRNHHKNVSEWMVEVQQPIIQDLLTRLQPIVKTWKKGRPASAVADATESFGGEDGRSTKSQRT